jgi:hypothetical protein
MKSEREREIENKSPASFLSPLKNDLQFLAKFKIRIIKGMTRGGHQGTKSLSGGKINLDLETAKTSFPWVL